MAPAAIVEAAPARGAGHQAELDQERFDHFLDGVARFRKACRQRFDPDRPALVDVGNHREVAPVLRVEPQRIDFEPGQRIVGNGAGNAPAVGDMGEIAHPPQQAPRNTRSAARAPGASLASRVRMSEAIPETPSRPD